MGWTWAFPGPERIRRDPAKPSLFYGSPRVDGTREDPAACDF
ncbi:MAG: hypothetical protein ACUVYA_02090 [Planctomycetota bacterium]